MMPSLIRAATCGSALFALLLVLPRSATAIEVPPLPQIPDALGKGIFDSRPETGVSNIYYETASLPVAANTFQDYANIKVLATGETVLSAMGFNATAAARFGAATLNASYNRLLEARSDSDTYVAVVFLKREFMPKTLVSSIVLTDDGRRNLGNVKDITSASEFLKAGGTHVLTAITPGGYISVVYEFKGVTDSTRSRIDAALKASYAGVSGSVSSFKNELHTHSEVSVTATIVTVGAASGASIDAIRTTLDADKENLPAVKNAIANLAGSITPQTAVPLRYSSVPVSNLSDIPHAAKQFLDAAILVDLSQGDMQLDLARQVRELQSSIDLATYIQDLPTTVRRQDKMAELAEAKAALVAARTTLQDKLRGTIPIDQSVQIPHFVPERYVHLPLVHSAKFNANSFFGGRKSCNSKDNLLQCSPLHWDLTLHYELPVPRLLRSVTFRADDGSYARRIPLNSTGSGPIFVDVSFPDGYLDFSTEVFIGKPPADLRSDAYSRTKYIEMLGRPAYRGKHYYIETVDLSGNVTEIPLPDLTNPDSYPDYRTRQIRFHGAGNFNCDQQHTVSPMCTLN